MLVKKAAAVFLLGFLSLAWGCSESSAAVVENQPTKIDIEQVARSCSTGVGFVGRVRSGKNATPIVVLEENHASRAGQIEHAITLVRLNEKFGMRDIALEGYLKERDTIRTDWFVKASGGDLSSRKHVALSFLVEGEISCAEFLILVNDEIQLHPIEQAKDYDFKLSDKGSAAPIMYLVKIAQDSLEQDEIRRVNAMQEELARMPEGETKNKKIQEMLDFILGSDPWVAKRSKLLRDIDTQLSKSTTEMVKTYEEISNRGEVFATDEEKTAMESHLMFMRGRAAADETMARAASVVANEKKAGLVAMVIGALHTNPVCDYLNTWGRPFAVVSPASFKKKDKRGDLPYDMYRRKYDRLPVHSDGIAKSIFESVRKKPEPVLGQKWFQADAEMRLFGDRIVRLVLGDGSGGEGGGPPIGPVGESFGLSRDDFTGTRISVDIHLVEVVLDDSAGKEDSAKAVLFPVRFKSDRVVWIKAAPARSTITAREEDLEEMLQGALEDVRKRSASARKKREDSKGRFKLSLRTVAAASISRQAAKNVRLMN